jgi:hypothetical protein
MFVLEANATPVSSAGAGQCFGCGTTRLRRTFERAQAESPVAFPIATVDTPTDEERRPPRHQRLCVLAGRWPRPCEPWPPVTAGPGFPDSARVLRGRARCSSCPFRRSLLGCQQGTLGTTKSAASSTPTAIPTRHLRPLSGLRALRRALGDRKERDRTGQRSSRSSIQTGSRTFVSSALSWRVIKDAGLPLPQG